MNRTLNRQPKALYMLFFVKMWECFSFYGMRALMVLYLINQLGVSECRSYGIYAIYCALVEFSGIIGGRVADRFLGLRKSIIYGGWLIAAGHIYLSLHTEESAFFVGLALIVVGSGLFSTNISALLGLFYGEEDPRREKGFTLFYVGINIGALLASIFCGIVGEMYGWHYGFTLAAVGMVAGNILFLCSSRLLEGKGDREKTSLLCYLLMLIAVPVSALMIAWEQFAIHILPIITIACALYIGRKMVLSKSFSKEKLYMLGVYLVGLAVFFAAEDQTASLLLVFSERHASQSIGGIAIPMTTLLSINPFFIIVGGLLLSRYKITNTRFCVSAGLLLAASVFAMLALACLFPNQDGLVPMAIVASGMAIISLGEVLVGPALFSYCSEIAPKEWLGATMGLIPLGFSLGNVLSGLLSKAIVADALEQYAQGFSSVAALIGLVALLVITVNKTKVSVS